MVSLLPLLDRQSENWLLEIHYRHSMQPPRSLLMQRFCSHNFHCIHCNGSRDTDLVHSFLHPLKLTMTSLHSRRRTATESVAATAYHSSARPPTHSISAMESWLGEVKQLRIPRPKFGVGLARGCVPIEPPRDYYEDYQSSSPATTTTGAAVSRKTGTTETEKMRQSLQQNL